MARNGIDSAIMRNYRDKLLFPVQCVYCGKRLDIEIVTIEHKVPLVRGGKSVFSNFTTSCHACNTEKNCLTHHEYLDILKRAKDEEDKLRLVERAVNRIRGERVEEIKGFGEKLRYIGLAEGVMPVEQIQVSSTTQKLLDNMYKDKFLENIYEQYLETGIFNSVIHISENNTILKGFAIYAMAVQFGIKYLPVRYVNGKAFFYRKKNKKFCRIPINSDTLLSTKSVDRMNKGEDCRNAEDYISNLSFFLEFGFFREPVYIKTNSIIGHISVLEIAKKFGIPFIPVKFINSSDEFLDRHA